MSQGIYLDEYNSAYVLPLELSNDPHKVASKEILINHLKTSFVARLVFNKNWNF